MRINSDPLSPFGDWDKLILVQFYHGKLINKYFLMSNQDIRFNYIVTVHNKQNLIREVLLGIINAAGVNSHIYPVLDGCNDASEKIIDELIRRYPAVNISKLFASDVHELKSINIGLSNADQQGIGYNIILQDDVILADKNIEKKCINLYQNFPKLGLLSFRHGGNISRERYHDESSFEFPLTDYIQNQCGHYPNPRQTLKTGFFTFKEIVIKSPICIPFNIVRDLGMPDEKYAPWDDMAYSYHVSYAGYANGVLSINFISDVSWGTTRNKKQRFDVERVMADNLVTLREQYHQIPPLDTKKYSGKQYQIFLT